MLTISLRIFYADQLCQGTSKERERSEKELRTLTVIIGKIGPKISSFMTAESSGGSSKIVGSITLKDFTLLS